MGDTVVIQLKNKKAIRLLHDMEELDLIKVLKEDVSPIKPKLSEKYKNVFTDEDAKSFDSHTNELRKEWENT